ncbi:MAG: Hsp20 family protein [Pseudomonadota bacterium]
MTTIDFSPLYRTTVGFDRMVNLLNAAVGSEPSSYPPYNIEATGENTYSISIAVSGFGEDEIDLEVERGVLAVRARKAEDTTERRYLHRGIATRSFERKFNLADHIEVTGARLVNGLLTIELVKELPEAMKPRKIAIGGDATRSIEHEAA